MFFQVVEPEHQTHSVEIKSEQEMLCRQISCKHLASLPGRRLQGGGGSHLKCISVAAVEVWSLSVVQVYVCACCVWPVVLMSGETELQPVCDMHLIGLWELGEAT